MRVLGWVWRSKCGRSEVKEVGLDPEECEMVRGSGWGVGGRVLVGVGGSGSFFFSS